jgi:hydrocephalus-inducing protein
VEFVSHTVQKYTAHNIVLDIPGVAPDQLSIPLRAECAVPKIALEVNPLEFGSCFVRYPYKRTLKLSNHSKLPAKFEVLPQESSSKGLALFTVEPSSGGIPALGEQTVEVSLCTQTLGRVQLPVRIRIPGSRGRPLEFVIDARSMGPDLLLGPECAPVEALQPCAVINYGNVPVLLQHKHPLQVCHAWPVQSAQPGLPWLA